jgi:hypothetical protein
MTNDRRILHKVLRGIEVKNVLLLIFQDTKKWQK